MIAKSTKCKKSTTKQRNYLTLEQKYYKEDFKEAINKDFAYSQMVSSPKYQEWKDKWRTDLIHCYRVV